jgi:2-dehydro-3-deoxyphosphogluconate aldolase/(4S)-4-hydroxy-2-oxoglutarate aldolase
VATVSEIPTALEAGYTELKFFPAAAEGGPDYLRSVSSPIPAARFCPTGGISTANAARYLALPNVGCVGGSWITPSDVVAVQDWARVTGLAAAAATL